MSLSENSISSLYLAESLHISKTSFFIILLFPFCFLGSIKETAFTELCLFPMQQKLIDLSDSATNYVLFTN